MTKLTGKTAIVTGASRGIGAATARHLAAEGATVILAARDAGAIRTLASEIATTGATAHDLPCDVTRYGDVAALVAFALAETGRLDVLVNNAGRISPIARLADSDPDAWGAIADTNYKGVYHGLRAAIPAMLGSGGVIVNISSGAATSALEGWSHYCSSKAAVLSLTACAHKEYGDMGIRVIGLSPGTVATGMQGEIRASGLNPVSRLDPDAHIPPEWVARAVAFLCTDAARPWDGTDYSLKTDEGRARIGLGT